MVAKETQQNFQTVVVMYGNVDLVHAVHYRPNFHYQVWRVRAITIENIEGSYLPTIDLCPI